MFRVGQISVRFPGKLLLALTVLLTVSIVLTRPVSAWDETFSKNLATTVLGMGCSDVSSFATTTDLATNMLKAIPDTATPAQIGISSGDWDQNSPVIDQIKADPGIIGTASLRSTTQCADLAKLLRYGNSLSQGTTPTPQTDSNTWLAKLQSQISPLKSGWIDTLCKDSIDPGCRTQAEQTIAQLANACSIVDEKNNTPTTIKSYDDLKNCANKNNDYLKSQEDACSGDNQKWDATTNTCTTASPGGDDASVCTGGTLGWIMCPLLALFETANRFMAPLIETQLKVGPLVQGDATYAGTLPIWQTMVGVANLLLVIGFLVVIFSQATSIGLNAYGIKKMLPRIIAAAILINLSYFICTISLDIINVLGASMQGIIKIGMDNITTISGFKTDFGDILTTLGGVALGTYAIISGALAFLVPLGITAIMAILVIFLGLALRKVMIILLIIVAPLAFAAMILPGTEGLFKKWYKSLGGLLIMYPVVMAILYGSALLAKIILASGGVANIDGSIDTSGTGNINIMLAYAVMALGPTAGTYMFIKSSNKIFGAAASAVNKLGSGLRSKTSSWAKEKQQNSRLSQAQAWNKSYRDANRIERQGKMTGIQGGLNKAASYAAGATLNPKKWKANAGKYQASVVNRAAINDDKIFKEDRDNAAAAYSQNGIAGPLMVAHARSGRVVQEYRKDDGSVGYKYGRKLTEAEHAAAVEWTMSNGKLAERQEVYGSDWAAKGRNSDNRRALDAMNDGYFHTNKDVTRFGNRFGGTMTSGTVGGEMGVDNAAIVNMASGKTAAEAIIDNDMAQTLADLNALTPDELTQRIADFKLLPPEMVTKDMTKAEYHDKAREYAEQFRTNAAGLATTISTNRELQSRVKPEFQEALNQLRAGGAPPAERRARAVKKNTALYEKRDRLIRQNAPQVVDIVEDPHLTAIAPALDKTV